MKRIRGYKTEPYCNRVTELTMSLRLNLLKPLMLKTPTECNGLWINVCLREGNLHNFLLSMCNGSTHWSYLKEGKKLACNVCPWCSYSGEHEQESMQFENIFMFSKQKKYLIQLYIYSGDPANDQTLARCISLPSSYYM